MERGSRRVTLPQLATSLGGVASPESGAHGGLATRQIADWHDALRRWQTRVTALVAVPYCTLGAIHYYSDDKPWLVALAAAAIAYLSLLALLPNLSFAARLHGYLAFGTIGASLCFLLVG